MGPRLAEKGPGRLTPAGGGVSVEALPDHQWQPVYIFDLEGIWAIYPFGRVLVYRSGNSQVVDNTSEGAKKPEGTLSADLQSEVTE